MNFDQWWATLTIKEQTTIGRNNAKFVWDQATDAIINNRALIRQLVDAYMLASDPAGLKMRGEREASN